MLVISSKPTQKESNTSLELSQDYLKEVITHVAIPRHYHYEKANNIKVKEYITKEFTKLGLNSFYHGEYDNIVATPKGVVLEECEIIVGGHYDSVPKSVGADDNASAIAGVLGVAKMLNKYDALKVAFIAFNCEEDGLLGSTQFVQSLPVSFQKDLKAVHILEMIGYASNEPKSQFIPEGLPIKISDIGDFIAIISNAHSNHLIKPIFKQSKKNVPSLPLKALKVFLGMEKFFPHLSRSDHSPFWDKKIPALMWTDTSEFRNPHYHQPSDTPETLDYDFMQKVILLLGFVVLDSLNHSSHKTS